MHRRHPRIAERPHGRSARAPQLMAALEYASPYHAPVMPAEVVDLLITSLDGLYVDGTLGGGGHTHAILDRLSATGRVAGIDRDPEARAASDARLGAAVAAGRLVVLPGNFADMAELLDSASLGRADGVLLDLGVSSHQFDEAARGFAFSADGPLDMRMDPSQGPSAADLINELEEKELVRLLRAFGEEPRARQIVRAIRKAVPIQTTGALAAIVRSAVPTRDEVKTLARVFQALRIAVNDELGALEQALLASARVLKPGGRLAVISYHSLEDRRVKRFLRSGNLQDEVERDLFGNVVSPWEVLTRKAVTASEREIARNPRARSARLRVAQRTETES